ncbi:MAG: hypothetical protein ABFS02_02515 [Pseudomonadota bacterium]
MLPGLENPEQILPRLAQEHLGTFLYILFAGALISAILSTVDSALLAASSLASHNLIVPLNPGLSDQGKVRIARYGVVLCGILAYVLALYAEGVYSLVEEASAFGSAGIFTVVLFGLFPRFGGVRSAGAALLGGISAWVVGNYVIDLATPYLISLATALGAYVAVACRESRTKLKTADSAPA